MNASLPIRTKLITAALSLVVVYAFSTLHDIVAARSSGEVAFRLACLLFAAVLAFPGVFRSAQLQLLWGWCLVVAVPFLISLCIFVYRGSDLMGGLFVTLAASVGGYLLLADASVRDYRESIRRRHAA